MGLIILIIVTLLLVIGYFSFYLLFGKGNKQIIVNNKANLPKNINSFSFPISNLFIDKQYEDVFINVDGIKLHAYEFKQQNLANHNWVIIVHGYSGDAKAMSRQLDHFYHNGQYNVLCVDLRCSGLSEGKYITMGKYEADDIVGWINYLNNKYNHPKIILYGESMGAATIMQTSGKQLSDNVICAIEDCGYASTWEQLKYQAKNLFHLPAFPMLYIVNFYCRILAKFNTKKHTPLDAVRHSSLPMLFIHGDKDTFVPYYMHDILYQASTADKDKLVIHDAGHIYSNVVDPKTYWDKVDTFINLQLNKKSSK